MTEIQLQFIRQSLLFKKTRAELLGMLRSESRQEYDRFAEEQVRLNLYRFGVYDFLGSSLPADYHEKAPGIVDKVELAKRVAALLPRDHPELRLIAPEQCRARDMSFAELVRIAKQNSVVMCSAPRYGPHNQVLINAIFNANPQHQIFSRAPENLTPKHALEEFCLLLEKKVIAGVYFSRAEFLLRTAYPKSRMIDDLVEYWFGAHSWTYNSASKRSSLSHILEILTLEQEHFGKYLEQIELEEAMKEAEAGADELELVL